MNVDFQYYDISPEVSADTAVFPGDTAFDRQVSHWNLENGQKLELSSIQTTVHIGAHADAPSHYSSSGPSVEKLELQAYLGLCQVIRVTPKKDKDGRIRIEDISNVEVLAPRILFCTDSFNPNLWSKDFASLSPEVIGHLARRGVKLVGIDTPSVDPADSKKLESHMALKNHDMRVLEGLVLSEVPVGLYQLVALPLRIRSAEASPVRAILLPRQTDLSQK